MEAFTAIKTDHFGAFDKLKEYQETTADWIFGYLSYDLKNDVEDLKSANFDGLQFPDLYFFQPQKLIFLKEHTAEFVYLRMVDDEIDGDFEAIRQTEVEEVASLPQLSMQPRISKTDYFEKLEQLLRYIHRGDIYEANFCQEFYAANVEVSPFQVYQSLNEISNPPFAAFFATGRLQPYFGITGTIFKEKKAVNYCHSQSKERQGGQKTGKKISKLLKRSRTTRRNIQKM